jgi:hypothetical protein
MITGLFWKKELLMPINLSRENRKITLKTVNAFAVSTGFSLKEKGFSFYG